MEVAVRQHVDNPIRIASSNSSEVGIERCLAISNDVSNLSHQSNDSQVSKRRIKAGDKPRKPGTRKPFGVKFNIS